MTTLQALADGTLRPGIWGLAEDVDRRVLKDISARLGFAFFQIEGQEVVGKRQFLEAFSSAMDFPSYFGRNWDAFIDSASDLSWYAPSVKGIMVLYGQFDVFLKSDAAEFSVAIDCLNSVIDRWWDRGVPFYLLLVDAEDMGVLQPWVPIIKQPYQLKL